MAKYKCKVCGYIHEGNKAPDVCPVCAAPASDFEEMKDEAAADKKKGLDRDCLLYTSPSPRDKRQSRMPSSA